MLYQIMETQPEHNTDSGEQGRAVDAFCLTYDEFQVVNIVLHPLGQHCQGEGSLHPILDSLTHSESSDGSWDPIRELYAVAGGEAATEVELKAQEDKAVHLQAVEI